MDLLIILARVVGCLVALAGVLMLVRPKTILDLARWSVAAPRFWWISAIRVAAGAILLATASSARLTPLVILIGLLMIVAGIAVPAMGRAGRMALIAWLSRRGARGMRALAPITILLGAFIAWAHWG
jgi:hypothetical protein